jgi:hypothetical protein
MMATTQVHHSTRCHGQTIVEFAFVGIPLIFVLISVFEMARGMWLYQTLAYSAKAAVRYASVHGFNCTQNTNACTVNVGPVSNTPSDCLYAVTPPATRPTIATVVWCTGVGLDPATTTLILTDGTGIQTSCVLNACGATTWPPTANNNKANQVGQTISIQVTTTFKSMIAMFWPGSKPIAFGQATLPASSTDTIKF